MGHDANIEDLETCKTRARAANANTFNYLTKDGTNRCYYKSCVDLTQLHLTTEYGGYDVYVVKCWTEGECILSAGGW